MLLNVRLRTCVVACVAAPVGACGMRGFLCGVCGCVGVSACGVYDGVCVGVYVWVCARICVGVWVGAKAGVCIYIYVGACGGAHEGVCVGVYIYIYMLESKRGTMCCDGPGRRNHCNYHRGRPPWARRRYICKLSGGPRVYKLHHRN